jgi:anaerobic dimethyl sulfoxide reductase subunit C (anchor subunit)
MSVQWSLVFFTLFIGLGTGVYVAGVAITEWWGKAREMRITGAVTALVFLVLGGISSVLHLGHPERIFGALGHPTSGIFVESLLIGLTGLASIAYIIAIQKAATEKVCRVIASVGVVPAVLLAFAVGYTYVLPSRPAWDTFILPLLYLASAAAMGCFGIRILLKRMIDPVVKTQVDWITLAALLVEAVLLFAYLIHLAVAPYPDISRSASRVLTGNLVLLFWGGVVLVGLLLPAFLVWSGRSNSRMLSPSSRTVWGFICVLLGAIAFRVLMFDVGSSIRQFF